MLVNQAFVRGARREWSVQRELWLNLLWGPADAQDFMSAAWGCEVARVEGERRYWAKVYAELRGWKIS